MICHHSKCIFVHIPRTAGTSIERVFLNNIGLAHQTRTPLFLGNNPMPGRKPLQLEHLTAKQYVQEKFVPQEMYDRYFKFCFVRNPWDRMVSFYKHFGYARKCDFKTFVMERFLGDLFFKNFSWFVCQQSDYIYGNSDTLLVDFIGRFENLQEDFQKVCSVLGLPETRVSKLNESEKITTPPMPLRRIKNLYKQKKYHLLREEIIYKLSGNKTKHYDSYQEYYDKESMEFVARVYKRDIKTFGYDFEKVNKN